MKIKGLTATFVFEAESANYGEGVGNITSLKKVSRGTGDSYTYISRQALRFNIISQMGEDKTPLSLDGSVIQFSPEAKINDYPEIDLFGYMKTVKPSKTRNAVVRLSNAIALESYNSELDFLTNKGLLDRFNRQNSEKKDGGNIAQSEVHKSLYTYTIAIDLDRVGIDENDNLEIDKEEKAKRINKLLDIIKLLYRDIKGRRENFSPIFAIGGVYDLKNPFFENKVRLHGSKIGVDTIESVLKLDEEIKQNTVTGLVKGIFTNEDELMEKLDAIEIGEFFEKLKTRVNKYYEV
ncbi:MAG: type I-B CRISPR-associated protein Cas7/Cst2/DevR [Clostridiaceae bacterium]|nr:type I-B CRISPR-associated protein Cas7/Cst2/DevR [Clostridiaceae bacterium]